MGATAYQRPRRRTAVTTKTRTPRCLFRLERSKKSKNQSEYKITGLIVDSSGNVFVADTGNAAIREVTPAGVVTTLAITSAPVGPTSTAPSITSQPAAMSVTAGNNATFSVTASGNPAPSLQWQREASGGTTWSM